MPENGFPPSPEGSPLPEKKLVSWKEIAAHLGREVRTVQRWEKTEALPVKRHEHQKKSTVYAYASELDDWIRKRQPVDDPEADAAFVPDPDPNDSGTHPVSDSSGGTNGDSQVSPEPDHDVEAERKTRQKRFGKWLGAAALGGSLLALAVLGTFSRLHSPVRAPERVRLAVLPFTYLSGDSKPDYITAGLTDVIRTKLGQLDHPHLGVIAATSSNIVSSQTIPNVGRTLDVQYVLEGSVQRVGNQVRIDVQLIQVSDATHLWADSFTRELSDVLQVESDVSAAIAEATAILGQVPNDGIPPRDAKPKAREDAQRALQLNPRLAEAHAVLGNMAMSYDWDLATAEKELRRAIELNANDPTAHEWYCHLLIVEGRNAEALTEARQALDLDPVAPLYHTVLAETYYYGREYDAAIDEAQQVVKLHPDFLLAQFWLGSAYREKKMYPRAVETFQRARQLSGDNPAMLMAYGHTQALAGNVQEARATLQKLQPLAGTRFVPNLYPAAIHVGLGEADEAFRLLELAYQERIDRLVYLNVDPMADPIRSDPRCAQLMAKIGFH